MCSLTCLVWSQTVFDAAGRCYLNSHGLHRLYQKHIFSKTLYTVAECLAMAIWSLFPYQPLCKSLAWSVWTNSRVFLIRLLQLNVVQKLIWASDWAPDRSRVLPLTRYCLSLLHRWPGALPIGRVWRLGHYVLQAWKGTVSLVSLNIDYWCKVLTNNSAFITLHFH